jgi:uncharacterized protein
VVRGRPRARRSHCRQLRLHGVSDDPDDDKYLAAAVEGRAAFVVTGDPDLLAGKEHAGVRIVSPREFLDVLSGRV